MTYHKYDELIGQTVKKVYVFNNEIMTFDLENGKKYSFYHSQDCCESVYIEDIVGFLSDLEGSPLLVAEEISSEDEGPSYETSEEYEWTFYKFSTIKGSVTVRWYGTSNGYYSMGVSFKEITNERSRSI